MNRDGFEAIGASSAPVLVERYGIEVLRDPRMLAPLDAFYERAGLIVPRAVPVAPERLPSPYRELLVHDRDMTPTLEAFHGERLYLRVIGARMDADGYCRLVVLTTGQTLRPAEFGAIRIHLSRFPPPAQEAILANRRPLGTILANYRIEHRSRPQAFMRVASDPLIKGALDLAGPQELFGRRNVLVDRAGEILAEVVEILPPLPGFPNPPPAGPR